MPSGQGNRLVSSRKGQTLVEVTLILPLLIVLVGAALDWGLLFFVSHVVQNGVREGARTAVTRVAPGISTAAVNEVLRVIPDTPLFTEFRTNVTVTPVDAGANSPCFLRVRTNGNFSFYFMRILGFSTTAITRETAMKYERNAEDCPALT